MHKKMQEYGRRERERAHARVQTSLEGAAKIIFQKVIFRLQKNFSKHIFRCKKAYCNIQININLNFACVKHKIYTNFKLEDLETEVVGHLDSGPNFLKVFLFSLFLRLQNFSDLLTVIHILYFRRNYAGLLNFKQLRVFQKT